MEPLLVTPETAFDMLGIKMAKGYKMIMSGELPSIKLGGSRRVPLAQLRAWVDAQVTEQWGDRLAPSPSPQDCQADRD